MIPKFFLSIFVGLSIFIATTENAFCIRPGQIIRGENGEIIPISSPGEPGVDFKEDQFVARLKHGYLQISNRTGQVSLNTCLVEDSLRSILVNNYVLAVNQVFPGTHPGDTLRRINGETIRVPDLSQVFLFHMQSGTGVLSAIEDMYSHEAVLYAEPNFFGAILTSTPDDTLFIDQWNIHTPDEEDSFGIGCLEAWEYNTGDSSIKIAIIVWRY